MTKLVQTAIFITVMFAAIYWEWPGSGYAHVFIAILYDMGLQLSYLLRRWRSRVQAAMGLKATVLSVNAAILK